MSPLDLISSACRLHMMIPVNCHWHLLKSTASDQGFVTPYCATTYIYICMLMSS
ncbi:hypothetical protein DAI22_11g208200 [Oryza sativa Japonica Group]|nr:hypothetical protein DAI22_11g208200 [Oryza sativa Japonica Group]